MRDFRFNYIITIHNKQDLIEQVLLGVIEAWREGSHIYPVLDGCNDNTESIIDNLAVKFPNVPITKITAPDVHEIKSINIALRQVPQNEKGVNIILQDDVVLQEPELEARIKSVYDRIGYSRIGNLVFRHGVNIYLDNISKTIEERDLIESVYGVGMCSYPLERGWLIERMVGVRSPECISCEVISKVGVMDEVLAPYTYDNHDMSLRCLQAGYHNYVFGLKFKSDIKWGGTRTNPHPEYSRVVERNKHYLYKKHKDFLDKFMLTREFRELKQVKAIDFGSVKDSADISLYNRHRKDMVGKKIYYISKYFKDPLKKLLISLNLY